MHAEELEPMSGEWLKACLPEKREYGKQKKPDLRNLKKRSPAFFSLPDCRARGSR